MLIAPPFHCLKAVGALIVSTNSESVSLFCSFQFICKIAVLWILKLCFDFSFCNIYFGYKRYNNNCRGHSELKILKIDKFFIYYRKKSEAVRRKYGI